MPILIAEEDWPIIIPIMISFKVDLGMVEVGKSHGIFVSGAATIGTGTAFRGSIW